MAQWPNEDELLSAVRAAGWLLEHHALRVLDDVDLHPRSGWAFKDPDDPTTSRELDVWSYGELLRDEAAKVKVTIRFLVECKQSSLPYVGVGHEFPDWRFGHPTQHVIPRKWLAAEVSESTATFSKLAWHEHGFRSLSQQHGESNFRVTQLTRLDRGKNGTWEANNSGVFTSLVYPLAKALRASQHGINREGPGRRDLKRTSWLDFALHFPVVLLSCPLYVVDATSANPAVRQERWTTAVRELKSQNVEGTFEFDIVTESAFAEYVSARIGFASDLAALIRTNPLKYTGETSLPT